MTTALFLGIAAIAAPPVDWLLSPPMAPVTIKGGTIGGRPAVSMSNGLINRTFIVAPNWATYSYTSGGDELLRSIQPEATFQLNNKTNQVVGGVSGIVNGAFINASNPLVTLPTSYQYKAHRIVPVRKRYDWTPGARHSNPDMPWPPTGKGLEVLFSPPPKPPSTPKEVLKVKSTQNLSTARQEWLFDKRPIIGRRFRFEFGDTWIGDPFLPKVNELQIRVNGKWLLNNGTTLSNIVTKSSGDPAAGVEPGAEKGWLTFDGNVSTLWDAVGEKTTGKYWIDVDFNPSPSTAGSSSDSSSADVSVPWNLTFDGLALTTQNGSKHWPPPGVSGYFWRPKYVSVQQYDEGPVYLPDVTLTYEMYEGMPVMAKTVAIEAPSTAAPSAASSSAGEAGEAAATAAAAATSTTSFSTANDSPQCYTIRGLQIERLAMQETKIGHNHYFDNDMARFQADRISLISSYARSGPPTPCTGNTLGWEAGCIGGAGIFGIFRDAGEY
jgi:hypothetical protein